MIVAPGANGSCPLSTEDATKPTRIIPLNNPQTRTTGFQGTRIYMAEPPGDEERFAISVTILRKAQTFHEVLTSVSSLRICRRAKNRRVMEGRVAFSPRHRCEHVLVRLKPYLHVTDSRTAVRPVVEHCQSGLSG